MNSRFADRHASQSPDLFGFQDRKMDKHGEMVLLLRANLIPLKEFPHILTQRNKEFHHRRFYFITTVCNTAQHPPTW